MQFTCLHSVTTQNIAASILMLFFIFRHDYKIVLVVTFEIAQNKWSPKWTHVESVLYVTVGMIFCNIHKQLTELLKPVMNDGRQTKCYVKKLF